LPIPAGWIIDAAIIIAVIVVLWKLWKNKAAVHERKVLRRRVR